LGSLGSVTGGFTTLVGPLVVGFFGATGGFVPPEIAGLLVEGLLVDGLVVLVTGLPVILSISNFVPAPIAAPVSAFTTLLVVEFGLLTFGLTVGFTAPVPVVVLVVGVVVVLFVIVGFVVGVVLDVSVVLGTSVVLGVDDVFVVKDVFGVKVVFGVEDVLVVSVGLVAGLTNVEVNGRLPTPDLMLVLEPPEPPAEVKEDAPLSEMKGVLSTPRMTLPSGARSTPLASGSCLLDVRFFRIAIFYPPFFTSEVRLAMSVIGVKFAPLAKVFAGAARATFLTCCVGAAF
jgi:hypothetical protein